MKIKPIDLETAMRERDVALKALRQVEWVSVQGSSLVECPWCHGNNMSGHQPHCFREAALSSQKEKA